MSFLVLFLSAYIEVLALKKILFLGLTLAGIAACNNQAPVGSSSIGAFVPVESLIDDQARFLDSLRPEVSKQVMANQKAETLVTQRINWAKELAMFKELDISKPGLRASYTISEPQPRVRLYTLKPDERANVQWLKVTFADDTAHIRSMEGVVRQSNYLYRSEKRLQLQLQPNRQGTPQIVGYRIANQKKILFNNEENLHVEARMTDPVFKNTSMSALMPQ